MSKTEHFDYLRTNDVLSEQGLFGDEIQNFYIEQKEGHQVSKRFPTDRNVLGLKFDYTSTVDGADYETLKKYAEVGLPGNVNPGYLLARIECHDPRNPDSEPFYIGAVVHLGAVCYEGDRCDDCDGREFDLLEWAMRCYARMLDQVRGTPYPHQSAFIWRGRQYFFSVNANNKIRVTDCKEDLEETCGCLVIGLLE